MSTNYPSALDSYTTKIDLVTDVMAADINNPQDAIIAIETELGLDPRGSYTDVSARFTDYAARIANLEIGWVALPNGTRVSDTSFTLPGDYSGVLKNFAKWKGFLSSQKYGYVLSSSYSSGTGLTTVNLVPNTDYSLSSAGTITGSFFSFYDPTDFPAWFNWNPGSLAGFSTQPTGTYKYSISNKTFFGFVAVNVDGISNATNFSIPLPVAIPYSIIDSAMRFWNSGSASTTPGLLEGSGSNLNLYTTMSGGSWAATGYKAVRATFALPLV